MIVARKVPPAKRRAAGRRIAANIRRLQRIRGTRTAAQALAEARGDSMPRVVYAPAPFLPLSPSLPLNSVVSVVLDAGERVEWTWATDPSGACYVIGYMISKPRRPRDVTKEDWRLTWDETYREMARAKENWSNLDVTLTDGIRTTARPRRR